MTAAVLTAPSLRNGPEPAGGERKGGEVRTSEGEVVAMNDWVNEFFRDYAEAFRSESRSRLLAKFCLPLTFLTKAGPVVLIDESHLSANMHALMRRYKQIGAVAWDFTIREVRAIGAGVYLAEIEWQFFDASHELLYRCDTGYILAAEAKAGVKVMAVIAHNENEEYEKALKRRTGI
jgi:hypothetical protein